MSIVEIKTKLDALFLKPLQLIVSKHFLKRLINSELHNYDVTNAYLNF